MRIFGRILFLIIFLLPSSVYAAGVGFVPSTGIWFSRTSFVPHETVRVYSVIINNDYYALEGQVGFYDNGEIIDTVEIKNLFKESAQQIRVFWEPTEGEHTLGARFIKAVAIDEKGKRQELDVGQINSFTGAPLTIGDTKIVPGAVTFPTPQTEFSSSTLAVNTSTERLAILGTTRVLVKKEGDTLTLVAPGRKETTSAFGIASNIAASAQNIFQKNREILAQAEQVANTITSTAGKIEAVYSQTKSTFDKGKEYYAKGQEYWNKAVPYVEKVEPIWNTVSDHNNPKRVVIIVGGVVVLWWLLRRSVRQGEFRE